MDCHVKKFSELTTKEFFEIAKLRINVFVVEQTCAYQELDELDEQAWHIWLQSGNEIISYARIIDKGKTVTFGRVLVNPDYRRKNLGKKLLEETLNVIAENYPDRPIIISAQAHLTEFYGTFGFKQTSDIYMEDDIPHIQMKK